MQFLSSTVLRGMCMSSTACTPSKVVTTALWLTFLQSSRPACSHSWLKAGKEFYRAAKVREVCKGKAATEEAALQGGPS